MRKIITTTAIFLGLAGTAVAQEKGDWTVGVGMIAVNPRSHSSSTKVGKIDVGNDVKPSFTVEYFVWDNIGIEGLAATPFKHNINLKGVGRIGQTKHLPPTVSMNYHFTNESSLTPFVGAGVNYTHFFKTKTRGALSGGRLKLKDTFGYALHGGLDFDITERAKFRMDMRYLYIKPKAKVNGHKIGKVKINPFTFGASALYTF